MFLTNFLINYFSLTNQSQCHFRILYGEQANFFADEIKPSLRHKRPGTVAMANPGPNLNASQFYITVGENMSSLDDQHTVFGIVSEGLETVMKINDAFTDQDGRPLQVIRCVSISLS
jgi:peptidyl-prolyl cis-trans isomerase-like 4